MSYKKYILLGSLLLAVALLSIFKIKQMPATDPDSQVGSAPKIKVTTSFYPLAFLAQEIGGPLVQVVNITPAGIEPHDFEPSPKDINTIYKSNLFIFNGGQIDAWGEKIRPDLQARDIPVIEMILEARDVLPNPASIDPHLWLDPTLMSLQADSIASALIKIDPTHAQEYNTNKEKLQTELARLNEQYQSGLANCQLREIITSHDAFGYLANRYNFNVLSILGLSPEEEPSPKKIAEIADLAKNKGIKYIFFESMVSPKLSETIASEIGAQTLVLDPIEGLTEQDSKNKQNYLTLMQRNLKNLQIAMVCQTNQSLR